MSQSNGTEQKPANALAAMHFARDALRVVSVTGSVANPGRAAEISRDLEGARIAVAELIERECIYRAALDAISTKAYANHELAGDIARRALIFCGGAP